MHEVKYNSPKDKPDLELDKNELYFESKRLLIKYEFSGKVGHGLGFYLKPVGIGEGQFHIDGHFHPNWNDCVTGWAYV